MISSFDTTTTHTVYMAEGGGLHEMLLHEMLLHEMLLLLYTFAVVM